MNIREMLRHRRNRERELAIVARKTEEAKSAPKSVEVPRRRSVRDALSEQVRQQLGIDNAVGESNVRKACIAGLTMIATQGLLRLKQQVMLNLPSEIRIVLHGRSCQQAFDFYWQISEFREVWAKLGFTEDDLRNYIAKQVSEVVK